MSFKWTESQARAGNIFDEEQVNNSYNAIKGEINGGLDRENLPTNSVGSTHCANGAFVKYSVLEGVKVQGALNHATNWSQPSGGVFAVDMEDNQGGWVPNTTQKIETLFQEGMLQIEFNCWYWMNELSTTGTGAYRHIWCRFEILVDGNTVASMAENYQYMSTVHLVANIPISTGTHKIEVRHRVSGPDATSGTINTALPLFYYDGGTILAINRYR